MALPSPRWGGWAANAVKERRRPKSLMPGNGVRDIRLLERLDLLSDQLDAHGCDGVFEVLRLGVADDWCRKTGFVEEPRQSNPRWRHAMSRSQGLQASND